MNYNTYTYMLPLCVTQFLFGPVSLTLRLFVASLRVGRTGDAHVPVYHRGRGSGRLLKRDLGRPGTLVQIDDRLGRVGRLAKPSTLPAGPGCAEAPKRSHSNSIVVIAVPFPVLEARDPPRSPSLPFFPLRTEPSIVASLTGVLVQYSRKEK